MSKEASKDEHTFNVILNRTWTVVFVYFPLHVRVHMVYKVQAFGDVFSIAYSGVAFQLSLT